MGEQASPNILATTTPILIGHITHTHFVHVQWSIMSIGHNLRTVCGTSVIQISYSST